MSSLWKDLMPTWRKYGKRQIAKRDSQNNGGDDDHPLHPDLFVIGGLQTMDNAVIEPGTFSRLSRGRRFGLSRGLSYESTILVNLQSCSIKRPANMAAAGEPMARVHSANQLIDWPLTAISAVVQSAICTGSLRR